MKTQTTIRKTIGKGLVTLALAGSLIGCEDEQELQRGVYKGYVCEVCKNNGLYANTRTVEIYSKRDNNGFIRALDDGHIFNSSIGRYDVKKTNDNHFDSIVINIDKGDPLEKLASLEELEEAYNAILNGASETLTLEYDGGQKQ